MPRVITVIYVTKCYINYFAYLYGSFDYIYINSVSQYSKCIRLQLKLIEHLNYGHLNYYYNVIYQIVGINCGYSLQPPLLCWFLEMSHWNCLIHSDYGCNKYTQSLYGAEISNYF